MVTTFLVYSDYLRSARTLDKVRLNRQCVEALEILNVIIKWHMIASLIDLPIPKDPYCVQQWMKTARALYKENNYTLIWKKQKVSKNATVDSQHVPHFVVCPNNLLKITTESAVPCLFTQPTTSMTFPSSQVSIVNNPTQWAFPISSSNVTYTVLPTPSQPISYRVTPNQPVFIQPISSQPMFQSTSSQPIFQSTPSPSIVPDVHTVGNTKFDIGNYEEGDMYIDKNGRVGWGYMSHSIIVMWMNHADSLREYIDCHIIACGERGIKNSMPRYYKRGTDHPLWIYDDLIHERHKSQLVTREIERNETPWYVNIPLYNNVARNLKYFWAYSLYVQKQTENNGEADTYRRYASNI
jgi:hypothetical protein